MRKYVRYNTNMKNKCSQHVFGNTERIKVYSMNNRMNHMRIEDVRSERRILKNRIRRQREMKKNLLILIMTVCLVVTCSISLNAFRSNAKDDSTETTYKYYKSVIVSNNDTLWTIAEKYMDDEHYDSINDYIQEVKSMNTLEDDVIHYGEYLVIPYYDNNYVG